MPDWSKVLKKMAEALAAARVTPSPMDLSKQPLGKVRFPEPAPNKCLFWDCGQTIRPDYIFCYPHYQ